MKRPPYASWLAISALALCFTQAGCSTAREPVIRTVEVKVPVRQACVPASVPSQPSSYPDDNLPTAAEAAAERYRLIAAANERRKARLAVVEPIISGCR